MRRRRLLKMSSQVSMRGKTVRGWSFASYLFKDLLTLERLGFAASSLGLRSAYSEDDETKPRRRRSLSVPRAITGVLGTSVRHLG